MNDVIAGGATPSPTPEPHLRNPSSLEASIARARAHLLGLQRADGHWCGLLEGDSILESEYALLLWYLGGDVDPRLPRLAARLRSLQQPEGGWAIYPGAAPDPSASVKAYLVLKLLGDAPEAPHMVRARSVILECGGLEAVNSFTRFYLALLGQIPWSECPAVPPELLMLPGWSPISLYEMSSWSRAIVVPLTILWALKPVKQAPVSIGELASGRAHRPGLAGGSRAQRSWRTFFQAMDRSLKRAERVGGFGLTRERALALAQGWMVEHLDHSAGLAAIFPSMVYSVLALSALGHGPRSNLLRHELAELEKLEVPEGDALRVQPCVSPVWDTALSAHALALTGERDDLPSLQRAAGWLLAREVKIHGDWAERTRAEPGGWAFEYENAFYPDCDDTAQVLQALARIPPADAAQAEQAAQARQRALQWLFAMQGSSGGWAAFDRDCEKELLTHVPFADHNAMLDPACPDITGRVLEALAREGVPRSDPAVRHAVRFLERTQERDGSWYGRWGCNYLYGTWLALSGLEAAGYPMRRGNVRAAVAWLHAHQNPDGGFGETYRSYEEPEQKGRGPSTAAQTAWALMGLLVAGEARSIAAQRAAAWLIHHQAEDGTWHDAPWTGTGFPRVFYLRYDLYDDYFPLAALAQLRARLRGDWSATR